MSRTRPTPRPSNYSHTVESLDTEAGVIGVGLAGQSAARPFEAEGVAAQVIEARDRVGGRTGKSRR